MRERKRRRDVMGPRPMIMGLIHWADPGESGGAAQTYDTNSISTHSHRYPPFPHVLVTKTP